MKLILAFFLLLGAFSAPAQSTVLSSSMEPLIVTNRDVFKEATVRPQKTERTPRAHDLCGEVLECRSNVLVVRTFVLKNIYGPVPPSDLPHIGNASSHLYDPPPLRPVIGQKKQAGPVVALRNYPDPAAVTNGQTIACRALMVGTYGWQASLVEFYDCTPTGGKVQP